MSRGRGPALAVGLRVLGTLSVLGGLAALAGTPPAVVLPVVAGALLVVVGLLLRSHP